MESSITRGKHKQNIFVLLLLFLISLFIITPLCNNTNIITIIASIQFIIAVIFFKNSRNGFFSISFIFLVMCYITHMGHYFINTFSLNANIPVYYDTFRNLPIDGIIVSGQYMTMILNAFTIGFIVAERFKFNFKINYSVNKNELLKIRIVGYTFILIGVFFELSNDIQLVNAYLSGSYLDTFDLVESGVANSLINFFKYGLLFVMISYKDNRRKASKVFFIYILFMVIPMLSGNRLNAVMFIVVGSYIYFKFIKTINIKTYLKLFVLAYVFLVFVNLIADFRVSGLSYVEIMAELPSYLVTHSPIFDALGEFGVTNYSVFYILRYVPSLSDFGYGLTYITSFVTVIPNFFGQNELFENFLLFTTNIPLQFTSGLGGSVIGELYYNFQYYSIPIAVLIGVSISYIESKFKSYYRTGQWINAIIILPIFIMCLVWCRGYFRDFIRAFVWNFVAIKLILVLSKNMFKSKK